MSLTPLETFINFCILKQILVSPQLFGFRFAGSSSYLAIITQLLKKNILKNRL